MTVVYTSKLNPCGKSCPDLERGDCKPSGDLRFMLAAFPKLGSVARIHTSSYRSIMQISSSLQQIQTITGGRLAGIRAKLVVRPEKTSYMSNKDQKRHSTTIYALNLEIQAAGIQELIGRMTDHARLFEQTRKMLGGGRVEIIEPDNERAEEIAPEFYPAANIAPVNFPKPEEVEEIVTPKKQANMDVACNFCGKVNGHEDDCKFAAKKAEPEKKEAAKSEVIPPGPVKSMYSIISVVPKTSAAKGNYVLLSVMTLKNEKGTLYAWDNKIMQRLLNQTYEKPIPMIAEVSEQDEKGKKYFQIDKLLELGAVIFDDSEPDGIEGIEGEEIFGEGK